MEGLVRHQEIRYRTPGNAGKVIQKPRNIVPRNTYSKTQCHSNPPMTRAPPIPSHFQPTMKPSHAAKKPIIIKASSIVTFAGLNPSPMASRNTNVASTVASTRAIHRMIFKCHLSPGHNRIEGHDDIALAYSFGHGDASKLVAPDEA